MALLAWLGLAVVLAQAAASLSSRFMGMPGIAVGAVLALVAVAVLARFLPLRSWTKVALLAVLIAPCWMYLALDERHVQPTPLPPLPASPSEAERASYETTLRFADRKDGQPAKEFLSPKLAVPLPFGRPAEWPAYLAKHGDEVQAARQGNVAGREYLQALDAFPSIADLTPPRFDAPIMPFKPWRDTMLLEITEAVRLAALGRGDEAAELLVPVLRVSRKLQDHSRTLVRFMVARVTLNRAMEAVKFVLEKSPPDAAHRKALAEVLAAGEGGPAMIGRIMWVDHTTMPSVIEGAPAGAPFGPKWLRYLPLATLLHPHRTLNEMARNCAIIADLAAKRDVAGIEAREKQLEARMSQVSFRNPIGHLLIGMLVPSFKGVVTNYWKGEDERLALIEALR
jgi:hypothetical protein